MMVHGIVTGIRTTKVEDVSFAGVTHTEEVVLRMAECTLTNSGGHEIEGDTATVRCGFDPHLAIGNGARISVIYDPSTKIYQRVAYHPAEGVS